VRSREGGAKHPAPPVNGSSSENGGFSPQAIQERRAVFRRVLSPSKPFLPRIQFQVKTLYFEVDRLPLLRYTDCAHEAHGRTEPILPDSAVALLPAKGRYDHEKND